MANPEHLRILKQGVEVWNKWRDTNPEVEVDLAEATLIKAGLFRADLCRANLTGTDFTGADLRRAKLTGADLTEADLRRADLSWVDLRRANLHKADLRGTNFNWADLSEAKFHSVKLSETIFASVNFSTVRELDACIHMRPSSLDTHTLMQSKSLPEVFLRGCGLPENLIRYLPSLQQASPIQFYSCFISYSSKDEDFAKRLHADLQQAGVRCWYAPEDMKIGEKIRERIDESIKVYDRLMIILSEHSLKSHWVEDEVESAIEKEGKKQSTLLFPIRLDEAIRDTQIAWAAKIRRSRHIGDFSN